MTTYSLFGSQTPAGNFTDVGLTLGTRIRMTVAGNITGLRWYTPNVLPASPVQWFVVHYDPANDGTPFGTYANGTFSGLVANTWKSVGFNPVTVSAGTEVVAEVWTSDNYVATGHFFDSAVTNGPLVGPADDAVTPRRNGRFIGGAAPAFPTSGFNATGYFVDILFDDGINPSPFVGDDGLQHYVTDLW